MAAAAGAETAGVGRPSRLGQPVVDGAILQPSPGTASVSAGVVQSLLGRHGGALIASSRRPGMIMLSGDAGALSVPGSALIVLAPSIIAGVGVEIRRRPNGDALVIAAPKGT